jgi:hypothetical protein
MIFTPGVKEMFKYSDCIGDIMGNMSTGQMLLEGKADLEWFSSNREELLTQYDRKFIAFCDRKVLDSDASLERLLSRLKRRRVDTSRMLIEFVSRVKSIL